MCPNLCSNFAPVDAAASGTTAVFRSRSYASAPWLVVLTVLLLAQGPAPVHATFIPDTLRAQMRSRIQQHLLLSGKARESAAQLALEAPSTRTSRMLAAAPAPIRVLPEFQFPPNLSASAQATIKAVVSVAVQMLRTYLQVRVPIGSNGLLIAPQYMYILDSRCKDMTSNPSNYGGQTCSGSGWVPTFSSSLPTSDFKYPSCGTATMNPAHVLSSSCVNSFSQAVKCQTSSSGATGGSQADFYLYVTNNDTACPRGVLAFAQPCSFDDTSNRPVMGALNLCASAITESTTDKLLETVMHEITHALGFTKDLFDMYVDPATNRVRGADKVVAAVPDATTAGLRGGYTMVIAPTVLREVRLQFNCPSLAGAAMEDQGGRGSAGSHWEYELFQGDVMTPMDAADSSSQRFSRMTLALMEDSGWYISNWTAAPYLDWGRNAGCSLPQQTCTAYSAGTPGQPYFCPAATAASNTWLKTCSFNGIAHGYCSDNMFANCGIVNTPMAPQTVVSAGSSSSPPPVVQPNCVSSSYKNGGSRDAAGATAFGWAIGTAARCLSTSFPITSTSGLGFTSTLANSTCYCWTAACTSSGSLTYSLAGQSVACPAGQTIALSSLSTSILQGTVTCPTAIQAAAVCKTLQCPSTGCQNPGGTCFEGACVCRIGNSGADCSQDLLSQALSLPPSSLPSSLPSSRPPLSLPLSPSLPDPSTTDPNDQGTGPSGSGSGVTGSTLPTPSPPLGTDPNPSNQGTGTSGSGSSVTGSTTIPPSPPSGSRSSPSSDSSPGKNKTIIIIAASVAGGVILLAVVAIIFVKANVIKVKLWNKPNAVAPVTPAAPGPSPHTPGLNAMQPTSAPVVKIASGWCKLPV